MDKKGGGLLQINKKQSKEESLHVDGLSDQISELLDLHVCVSKLCRER
jgi:hypothetical protein